jgi:cation transporter-like permease
MRGRTLRVIRSVIYGYLGAILGGLLVAVVGIAMGLSEASIAAASVPTGVIFGMLGLSLVWWRPVAQRVGLDARRPGRNVQDQPRR